MVVPSTPLLQNPSTFNSIARSKAKLGPPGPPPVPQFVGGFDGRNLSCFWITTLTLTFSKLFIFLFFQAWSISRTSFRISRKRSERKLLNIHSTARLLSQLQPSSYPRIHSKHLPSYATGPSPPVPRCFKGRENVLRICIM